MSDDEIEALERHMAEAVAAEDYEGAARLRDRIAALKGKGSKESSESLFHRQVPGRMGLGTDQQVMAPPKAWKRPKKPDLLTSNIKPRRGGR
ncbi:MAG TPA: UvrB/UvrC motif-containing protein [Caulobacteraceae bacterium]|jgi:hypothetical protein